MPFDSVEELNRDELINSLWRKGGGSLQKQDNKQI